MPEFNESRESANANVQPASLRESLLTEAHMVRNDLEKKCRCTVR